MFAMFFRFALAHANTEVTLSTATRVYVVLATTSPATVKTIQVTSVLDTTTRTAILKTSTTTAIRYTTFISRTEIKTHNVTSTYLPT